MCVCCVWGREKGVNGVGWFIVLHDGRCVTEKRRTCVCVCTKRVFVVIWHQSRSRWQESVSVHVSGGGGGLGVLGFGFLSLHYKINLRYTHILALCVTHTLPLEVLSDPSVRTGQGGGLVGEND